MFMSSYVAWKVEVWMDDAHTPGQGVVARECLLFGADMASDLLLARIVNGIFVPSEVVSREKIVLHEDAAPRVSTKQSKGCLALSSISWLDQTRGCLVLNVLLSTTYQELRATRQASKEPNFSFIDAKLLSGKRARSDLWQKRCCMTKRCS